MIDLVGGLADLEGRDAALHRRSRNAHPRGLSAHSALFPLLRLVWLRPAGCRRAEGLRAAEGGLGPAFRRACLGRTEKAAVGARSVARAALDAAGRRAVTGAAGKREMGHRRHPRAGRRPSATSAGCPIRCSGWRRSFRRTPSGMSKLAERLKLSNAETGAPSGVGRGRQDQRYHHRGRTGQERSIAATTQGSSTDCASRWPRRGAALSRIPSIDRSRRVLAAC